MITMFYEDKSEVRDLSVHKTESLFKNYAACHKVVFLEIVSCLWVYIFKWNIMCFLLETHNYTSDEVNQ